MPFTMKIQPVDSQSPENSLKIEPVKPPLVKSRLKRLFERQFLRSSSAENGDGPDECEPSSVCLSNMVQNFLEDTNEKQGGQGRCSRNRRNCFNGSNTDSSDDEWDQSENSSSGESAEILKSLVLCASLSERNLLADTAKIVEKNKICKRKDDFSRRVVSDELQKLGYDASVCKSRWEKSTSYPSGEYEYIDVIVEGDRLLVDIDFRSEFQIARSTKTYSSILQTLPQIFVGKPDRLQKIIVVVSDAAKQSLKKKGMHVPPWRKADYVKAKWLSPFSRTSQPPTARNYDLMDGKLQSLVQPSEVEPKKSMEETDLVTVFAMSVSSGEEEEGRKAKERNLHVVKRKNSCSGIKSMTGLALIMEDKP